MSYIRDGLHRTEDEVLIKALKVQIEVYINQGGYISISQDNDCYSSTVIALDECCIDKLIKLLLDVKEEYKIQFSENNE
jgi:hypothetical protein